MRFITYNAKNFRKIEYMKYLPEEVKKEIEIVDADGASEINPITEAECPECGHNKAFYWSKQTRAGDEPETNFFKCEKCKHQWRDYR